MPFKLRPNPSLYAKLAAQWETEELRRQSEAAARSYFAPQTNRLLIIFVIVILLLQVCIFAYKTYITTRRQTRRQLFKQHGRDVEDVITVEWPADEKSSSRFENEPPTNGHACTAKLTRSDSHEIKSEQTVMRSPWLARQSFNWPHRLHGLFRLSATEQSSHEKN